MRFVTITFSNAPAQQHPPPPPLTPTYFLTSPLYLNNKLDYHLGQNKMEQLSPPPPPKSSDGVAKEHGGRGVPDVSFILSKIVVIFEAAGCSYL